MGSGFLLWPWQLKNFNWNLLISVIVFIALYILVGWRNKCRECGSIKKSREIRIIDAQAAIDIFQSIIEGTLKNKKDNKETNLSFRILGIKRCLILLSHGITSKLS